MSLEDDGEHEVTWLVEEEDGGQQAAALPPLSAEERVSQLESELQAQRRELADVRKELAAKTVQLMRKEQAVAAAQQQPAASAAVAGSSSGGELERQLHQLAGQVHQLQMVLVQREEELDEARKLAATQKRALREAAAQQGEREAAERAAAEASRAVAGQAVEEELERLTAELAAVRTRSELELASRDAELRGLKSELTAIHTRHKEALAAAEGALTEAWQTELNSVQATLRSKLDEYEAEVARLRTQLEDARNHADSSTLISELAMLNNQKVQVQREFEAFKDMATQAARKNREEVAKLLEENAALHSKLAGYKTAELMGSRIIGGGGAGSMGSISGGGAPRKTADMLSDQPPPGASISSAYGYLEHHMPQLLARWERHRRGLVPMMVVGGLLSLILVVTVVRAAASTRSQHGSSLCFLAKLGISIGTGCGANGPLPKEAAEGIAELLDHSERIHDVDLSKTALPAVVPADTATGGGSSTLSTTDLGLDAVTGHSSGSSTNGGGSRTSDEPEVQPEQQGNSRDAADKRSKEGGTKKHSDDGQDGGMAKAGEADSADGGDPQQQQQQGAARQAGEVLATSAIVQQQQDEVGVDHQAAVDAAGQSDMGDNAPTAQAGASAAGGALQGSLSQADAPAVAARKLARWHV